MKVALRVIALVSIFVAAAGVVSGQETVPPDPSESARFQWGALRFTPGILVSDIGVDNNVFNDPDHQLSDSTAAIGPAINFWTHAGTLRIIGKGSGQYLYFKKFDDQRSWNTTDEVRLELPLSRFKPFAVGGYSNTRQRPGFEIDSRARLSTNLVTLGTRLDFSGTTGLILSGTRMTTAFDEKETFLGSELANALNRHSDTEQLELHYRLTPLTSLVVTTEATQDRFDHDRLRNSDSYAVKPGFEFKPFALISGKVSAGFRHFNVLNDSVEDFQGLVAAIDAKYTLTTSTRIAALVSRDMAFSFEEQFPYYTLTLSAVELKQRVSTSWDAVVRAGWQTLGYHAVLTNAANVPFADRGRFYGAGVGYLVGETLRIGFDANYYSRDSQQNVRNYNGLRAGASVSYGIPQ
jgi:hypothetical protein